ncbi:MAG TPA: hypothetical protein VMI11_15770, partial [Actinomycetes bacterium]|nr:hypothetical protein [Actinomycetes bacterium]
VRALLAESVQRHIVRVGEIETEVRDGQIRGSRLIRSALAEVAAGVRSFAEGQGWRLVQRSPRLRKMMWNPSVYDASGRFIFRPDGWLDDVALAWQIDSKQFHTSPEDWARTVAQHTEATAIGIVVVHHLPQVVERQPAQTLAQLEAAADVARARPRPNVYAIPAGGETASSRRPVPSE